MSTWLDRPLSIAGRAIAADGRNIMEYLVNADKDLVVIPNLAILWTERLMMDTALMHRRICFLCLVMKLPVVSLTNTLRSL